MAHSDRDEIVVSRDGGLYATIGDALRDAPAGGRVVVRPGVYRECLVLTRAATVCASGGPVVVEGDGESCVRSQAEGAALHGLTLEGRPGRSNAPCAAVEISHGSLELSDCRVSCDSGSCVLVCGGSAQAVLARCRVYGSARAGVEVVRGRAEAERCDLYGHGLAGILIGDEGSASVCRSQVRDCEGYGVLALAGGRGAFSECRLYGHERAAVGEAPGAELIFDECRIRREGLVRWLIRFGAIVSGIGAHAVFSAATDELQFVTSSFRPEVEPTRPLWPTARGRLRVAVTAEGLPASGR